MADEQLTWDGLALHNEPFAIEGMTFTAAKKKRRFASNSDSDGEALIDESHYENSKLELRIRVEPQSDMDTALAKLGELRDKVQNAERILGGTELEWRPAGSTETFIAYVLSAEETELPTVLEGEDSGYFGSKPAPVVKIELVCRPFLYREEREVLAATEGTGPQQVLYVSGIEGDVPAEARLVVTDKVEGGQDRRFLEWGAEQVESEEGNPDLLLEADTDFTVEGFQGELAEGVEGSHSTKVIKSTLFTNPVALAAATELPHKTPHYGKLRVKAEGEGALFRLAYRTADGEWRRPAGGEWQQPPVTKEWCELSMRELGFEEVEQGSQVSDIRIEAKCEDETVEAYVDTLGLTPTDGGRGEGRGVADLTVPALLTAADSFNQSNGNATGKVNEVGGEYKAVEGSDETDFEIADGKLIRESTEDSGLIGTAETPPERGRAIGTADEVTDVVMRMDLSLPSSVGSGGVIVSYVDNENFFTAVISRGTESEPWNVGLRDAIGEMVIFTYQIPGTSGAQPFVGTMITEVVEQRITVYVSVDGGLLVRVASLEHPMIGAKGQCFIYDENTQVTTSKREYDNVAMWVPNRPKVCHASQSAEVRHIGPERENEGGTAWAPMPFYRGANFYLPPQGDDELLTRLLGKMRRNDSRTEPDVGLEDAQTVKVLARERFLAPR